VLKCAVLTALSAAFAVLALAGCSKQEVPTNLGTGDPLAELPVVLSRDALVVQDQTRGIGTLFNEPAFRERNREAERVKAEYEAQIQKLRSEIEERFAYIKAVEALKNNIETDSSVLPPYFELVSQIPRTDPSDQDLWKLAAVWVALEGKATQYRQFVDDICAGQMARKYLSLSDDIQKGADSKIQSVFTSKYNRFSDISKNYGKESRVSSLQEHLETLKAFSQTLTWLGRDYYDMQHTLYTKSPREGSDSSGRASKGPFSTSFDEIVLDIQTTSDKIRSHIAVCKVYNSCMKKFSQLLENRLQANDVPLIDGLKDQLTDAKLQAPNADSENLLASGREEMDKRVEQEVARMRGTLEQFDKLCTGRPNFADPDGFLDQLRKGQEELRAIKSVFYALNLFDEAQKADDVRAHSARLEKAFGRLREMNDANEEMQGYARELQQMPGYGFRSSSQQNRADQIADNLRDYRIRFSKYRSDLELQEDADHCLNMIDKLLDRVGG